mgnify:CR=1 FL=1
MSLKERSSSLHRSTLTSDAALAQVLWANRWFSVGNTIVSAALLYHKLTTYSLGKIIEVDPVYVHVGIYIVWLSLEWLRLYFGTVGNLLETVRCWRSLPAARRRRPLTPVLVEDFFMST